MSEVLDILLEFNDSDEELLAAQAEAQRLGVDEFLFVITHSAHRSRRFTQESAATVPLASPIARIRCTPALERNRAGRGNERRADATATLGTADRRERVERNRGRGGDRRGCRRRWFGRGRGSDR